MMRTIVAMTVLFLLSLVSPGLTAEQSLGQVASDTVRTTEVTLPVYHDTTGRTDADLTEREKHFLSTVPTTGGLREAVREMVLADVVHVPALKCGNYTAGDSVRYWSMYQAWTGPAKVKVPVIQGPAGKNGPPGPQGSRGPRGPQGSPGQGTVINNYSFNSVPMGSYQIGGAYAPMVVSTQIGSVNWVPSTRINICVSATGGSIGPINNSNTNVNSNANNNVVNVGPGSASGTATGTGTGSATSGN